MRQLISTRPLVYRAYQTITEGVRGADWNLYIPDNEKLETWLTEAIEPIWSDLIANAVASVFYGFAVCEVWGEKIDEWVYPRQPVFPCPETVELRVNAEGEYAGYRQTDYWIGGRRVEVPVERSIHWVYGGPPHNDPYGIGALRVITDYARDQAQALGYALEVAYRDAIPIMVATVPQTGVSEAGANAEAEAVYDRLVAGRLLVHKSLNGETVKIDAVQPNASAVKDIMTLVDYEDRQIALGLLVALRTMYNAAGDGGSYSLVEVQRDEADDLIAGIIGSLRPGLERFVEMVLTANGYGDLMFDLDIERPSDMTKRAARNLMVDLVRAAGLSGQIDIDRLANLSGLPVVLPQDVAPDVETPPESEEMEPVGKEKMARKVELPPAALEARRQLDIRYEAVRTELERAELKSARDLTPWIERCMADAEAVYRDVRNAEPPELSRAIRADWGRYATRLWKSYQADIDGLRDGLISIALRGIDTTEREGRARENLWRKLAAKAAASVYTYFTDLERARV